MPRDKSFFPSSLELEQKFDFENSATTIQEDLQMDDAECCNDAEIDDWFEDLSRTLKLSSICKSS